MSDWWAAAQSFLTPDRLLEILRALLLVLAGLVVARISAAAVRRLTEGRLQPSQVTLLRRVILYGIFGIFSIAALHQLGFNLGVLVGAAGVFSVALAFASQTSASNIISGLFLIGERPFQVGDVIQVGTTTGEVLSIDLLSAKLRTFDNLFVRIPNETLLKAEVRTLTKFPIRRLDLQIGVAYREDVERVRTLLFDLADRNPLCLDEPKPVFIMQGFGDSAVLMQFSPWALRENFLELRNMIQEEIKQAFDEAGIEIPFPHRTLYTGSETDPFPVRLVDPPSASESAD
jgi:small-conductance mechanosensitive channel